MQLPVFLILFLAPVYVPLSLLEGWLPTVASLNPVTPLRETGRDFIAGEPALGGTTLGLALLLGAAFCAWAFRGLRKAEAAGLRRPPLRWMAEPPWPP